MIQGEIVTKGTILREISDIFETLNVPSNININLEEIFKIISSQKGGEYTILLVRG